MTIHTGPGAKVIGRPEAVVKVVPPSVAGRDQRAWKPGCPEGPGRRRSRWCGRQQHRDDVGNRGADIQRVPAGHRCSRRLKRPGHHHDLAAERIHLAVKTLWICTGTRITGAESKHGQHGQPRKGSPEDDKKAAASADRHLWSQMRRWVGLSVQPAEFPLPCSAEDPARWRGPLTPLVRAGPGDGRTAPDGDAPHGRGLPASASLLIVAC
jgi:hypothetical protein